MAFNDSFADCKAYTGARILFPSMQALKNNKYPFCLVRIYSDAIVFDREYPFISFSFGCDMNFQRLFAMELQCVTYKVLK